MGHFVDRTTGRYYRFANSGDFYQNPDMFKSPAANALFEAGVPPKYWAGAWNYLSGDLVQEMTPAQKAQVDSDELEAARDSVASVLDDVEGPFRSFALAVLNELNAHADMLNAIKAAAVDANNLAEFKAAMVAIQHHPKRTVDQLRAVLRGKLGT